MVWSRSNAAIDQLPGSGHDAVYTSRRALGQGSAGDGDGDQ